MCEKLWTLPVDRRSRGNGLRRNSARERILNCSIAALTLRAELEES
jgi:hypothetical protein